VYLKETTKIGDIIRDCDVSEVKITYSSAGQEELLNRFHCWECGGRAKIMDAESDQVIKCVE